MADVTVLYDEDCGFCTVLARWLERPGLRVEPIGSVTGNVLLRDLAPKNLRRLATSCRADAKPARKRHGPSPGHLP
jgi:hypothetical protein